MIHFYEIAFEHEDIDRGIIQHFQIQYDIIVRTGNRTYPRYFKLEFAFTRPKYSAKLRPINPAKIEQQAKVIELRSQGWSFPAIARHLDISVGTVWNISRSKSKDSIQIGVG